LSEKYSDEAHYWWCQWPDEESSENEAPFIVYSILPGYSIVEEYTIFWSREAWLTVTEKFKYIVEERINMKHEMILVWSIQ